jgi:hypothetical protein
MESTHSPQCYAHLQHKGALSSWYAVCHLGNGNTLVVVQDMGLCQDMAGGKTLHAINATNASDTVPCEWTAGQSWLAQRLSRNGHWLPPGLCDLQSGRPCLDFSSVTPAPP